MRNCRNGHLTDKTPCHVCVKGQKKRYWERYPEKKQAANERIKERYPEKVNWSSMLARCTNPNHKAYPNYGGRGIKVCESWLSYENFSIDMGSKPSLKHTLERIDNDKGYEPGNCRWATRKEQNRNSRGNSFYIHNGETRCLTEWAESVGIKPNTLSMRIQRGMCFEEAIKTTNNAKEPKCQMDEMK